MTIMEMSDQERRSLARCAEGMIRSGHWNELSDSAIKDAFRDSPDRGDLISAARRFRQIGKLNDMIQIQLAKRTEMVL